jgi:hypothetical protein
VTLSIHVLAITKLELAFQAQAAVVAQSWFGIFKFD